MTKRPLILVTNDDGIIAPGILKLVEVMKELGDVVVVAPDKPQSGKSHAITLDATLYLKKTSFGIAGVKSYACSGTPADCVKIGLKEVLDRKPDLCVSGINHGSNASVNMVYSGTLSAAVEAGIKGVPAIAFSLLDYDWNANFKGLEKYVRKIAKNVLEKGLPDRVVLNVNFPKVSKESFKGIKIVRQSKSNWNENFDKRMNPMGKEYFWLTGVFENLDTSDDTDEFALRNNFISVTPVKIDFTAHEFMDKLRTWNL